MHLKCQSILQFGMERLLFSIISNKIIELIIEYIFIVNLSEDTNVVTILYKFG
jgi:hypothetical protein